MDCPQPILGVWGVWSSRGGRPSCDACQSGTEPPDHQGTFTRGCRGDVLRPGLSPADPAVTTTAILWSLLPAPPPSTGGILRASK